MSDKYQIGDVVEGVITGVQPYGAFVSLGEDVQGLVHMSEVTNGFVKDITDHVKEGDKGTVNMHYQSVHFSLIDKESTIPIQLLKKKENTDLTH